VSLGAREIEMSSSSSSTRLSMKLTFSPLLSFLSSGMIAAASTNFPMWCAMICIVGFGCGGNRESVSSESFTFASS